MNSTPISAISFSFPHPPNQFKYSHSMHSRPTAILFFYTSHSPFSCRRPVLVSYQNLS
ncbi:hypothetical protein DL95DRAFT_396146 [Leptodontidium sp. 2 PMI_412]|nr:hypothetical protein DL95DRAFT_396146 [Leptodontidium sp. 2 PMI_412]